MAIPDHQRACVRGHPPSPIMGRMYVVRDKGELVGGEIFCVRVIGPECSCKAGN